MLEYVRIKVNVGIDVTKNKLVSKECWICGFWYFINKNFNYQKHLCNGCHDMSLNANSMHNLAIIIIIIMRIDLFLLLCLKTMH